MKESNKIRVGISIGDPNGIGIEIILKTFQDKSIYELVIPIIFGHHEIFVNQARKFGISISVFNLLDLKNPKIGKLNVVNISKDPFKISYGDISFESGAYAFSSLHSATRSLKKKFIDVLVTAPINKKSIQSDRFKFKGHTDYLEKELKGDSLMLMISDELKIALASDHIPIGNIISYLSAEKVENKLSLLEKCLINDFGIEEPRIAVLGINPHNGDNGVIGKEDDFILRPLIKKLCSKKKMIFGPFAADSFFGNKNYRKYDAVLAMYHDQGLIPFKTISFGQGVNYTAGLEYIRTSPDHGTAFDIAGKGNASWHSFREAVYKSKSIFLKRK